VSIPSIEQGRLQVADRRPQFALTLSENVSETELAGKVFSGSVWELKTKKSGPSERPGEKACIPAREAVSLYEYFA
jgi:hypothetical protein